MQYKVFTDFHHGSLLQSLILLFEKRLGGKVFRPIGLEWFEQGYWKINDQRDTAEQFLGKGSIPADGTPALNDVDGMMWKKDEYPFNDPYVYFCRDVDSGKFNNAITLEGFMRTDFDIVIASIPQHLEPFRRLCDLHPNKPKLIYQVGNAWNIPGNLPTKNVMASAEIADLPEGTNYVEYHQEFDLDLFSPFSKIVSDDGELTFPQKNIYSFINCFNTQQHFVTEWEIFQQVERMLPDWQLRSFGGQCRDGNITGARDLSVKMRESRFIWHTKSGGDGYGHILHNAFAVARPVIIRRRDYVGKLGDRLLVDGLTAIFIDDLSVTEIVEKIQYYSEPERYRSMCENVLATFRQVVNFDAEQKEIEAFLSRLQ